MADFVSAYIERNKNFFRKIEFFHFLPSFFAEKWCKKRTKYKVIMQKDKWILGWK